MTMILRAVLAISFLAGIASSTRGDDEDRIYDFTDQFYLKNGVNPAAIVNRANGTPPRSTVDVPFFSSQRAVRMRSTLPAYKHNGDIEFWSVTGDIFVAGFTNNEAGRKAKRIADAAPLYVFPRRDQPNPVTLGANRQADIVDMRHGYFSNNPLGLWIHIWILYTDKALNTTDGRKELAKLAGRNGLSADGTPIIKTLSELESLLKKGYVVKRFRNPDGSEGPMYGICPVIEDPTDGGIAPDAFLNFVRRPDGSPLEPEFLENFESLRLTGEWADD